MRNSDLVHPGHERWGIFGETTMSTPAVKRVQTRAPRSAFLTGTARVAPKRGKLAPATRASAAAPALEIRRQSESDSSFLYSPSSKKTTSTPSSFAVNGPRSDAALLRGRRHGKNTGGALALQMNIFERVSRVVRSYVNAAITAAEDPEKYVPLKAERSASPPLPSGFRPLTLPSPPFPSRASLAGCSSSPFRTCRTTW